MTKRLHNSSFLDIHYIILIHRLLVMYWDSLDSFGVQQTFDQWALSDCPSWHAHGGESLNMGELLPQDTTCMRDKDAWCHTEEWVLNQNSHILLHTIACRSTWGFQSLSYKITISAMAKLIPKPPALVLNMKINFLLPGMLYMHWLLIVSPHAVSVHPDSSTQILSTDSRQSVVYKMLICCVWGTFWKINPSISQLIDP